MLVDFFFAFALPKLLALFQASIDVQWGGLGEAVAHEREQRCRRRNTWRLVVGLVLQQTIWSYMTMYR